MCVVLFLTLVIWLIWSPVSNLILWPSQNTSYVSTTSIISIISIPITNLSPSLHLPRKIHFFYRPRIIRGHGGIALGWHKKLSAHISPLHFISSCRIIGVQLKLTPSNPVVIIAVYLPSRAGCTDKFREALDQLEASLPVNPDIIIMGDFNADQRSSVHHSPKRSRPNFSWLYG